MPPEIQEAQAATERQSPDGLLQQDNLTGTLADIDEDPDNPDANWLTYITNNVDTVTRVSFPTPTGSPTVGADLQEFKIWVRQQPDGAGADPTVSISLYENGALVAEIMAATAVSSVTGQLFSATWNANLLGTADGSLVELYIYGDAVGGAPGNRCTVEVGAVEWNVDYIPPTLSCDFSTTAVSFGSIDDTAVYTAGNITVTITAPAAGFTLSVQDCGDNTVCTSATNPGLYAATSTPSDVIGSATNTYADSVVLSFGVEGYGIRAATTTAGSGTLTLSYRYGVSNQVVDANYVGGLEINNISLASSTAAVTGREVVVTPKAAVAVSNAKGDYKDILTFTCSSP